MKHERTTIDIAFTDAEQIELNKAINFAANGMDISKLAIDETQMSNRADDLTVTFFKNKADIEYYQKFIGVPEKLNGSDTTMSVGLVKNNLLKAMIDKFFPFSDSFLASNTHRSRFLSRNLITKLTSESALSRIKAVASEQNQPFEKTWVNILKTSFLFCLQVLNRSKNNGIHYPDDYPQLKG